MVSDRLVSAAAFANLIGERGEKAKITTNDKTRKFCKIFIWSYFNTNISLKIISGL